VAGGGRRTTALRCSSAARAPSDARCALAWQTQTWGNTGRRTAAPAAAAVRPGRASEASAGASAGRASVLNGSRSLSTLLQKRSDAEADPLPDIDAADKENPLAVSEVRAAEGCRFKPPPLWC